MSILVLATSSFVEHQRARRPRWPRKSGSTTDPVTAPAGDIEALLAFRLAPGITPRFPVLRFVACAGAGVDDLLATPDLPPHVPVVRAVDPLQGQRMAQYVTLMVLRFARDLPQLEAQHAAARWLRLPPVAEDKRAVGVMGYGSIGAPIVDVLARLGYPVAVWTRTPHRIDGAESFAGPTALAPFLARSPILVRALPLTAATSGMLGKDLFAALPRGAYVINVSRGAVLRERELLAAVDADHLAGAALDVFATEPLPAPSRSGGIRGSSARRTSRRCRDPRSRRGNSWTISAGRARARLSSTSSIAIAATRNCAMTTSALWRAPELSGRWTAVWRRNQLVWRKLAIASLLGNVADPLLYMVALGFGIGAFVPEVGGMTYIAFLGTGMVCQSAMFTSSFEAMYSAFSRMHVQRTWEAIINAPVSLDDVMFAEWIWAASKAVTSTVAILAVILALGFGHSWLALWIIPLGFLVGLTFGAFGLVMNALAPGYDFFTYFFTLVLTPGLLLSGVFFPVEQMPVALQAVANLLPLKHAIDLARPLLSDKVPADALLHIGVLLAYAAVAFYFSLVLTRRRLLR